MKKRIPIALLLLVATTANVFAQGDLPCGDGDPDGTTCPLDTWVILFAAIALIFTVLHLKQNAKKQRQLLNN